MLLDYSQEGLPIEYDETTEEIIYKDNRIAFSKVKSALESGLTQVELSDNLIYTDNGAFVTFGCLELSKEKTQTLLRKLCKQLKMYNKIGN